MKYFKTFTLICIIGLLYSSCVKKANYPDIPQISYNSYIPFLSGSQVDSAYLRINFTDGNGDIGYPSQETGISPNCYIKIFVYVNKTNTFDSIYTFPYNIPDITPTGNDKELNGIIQINFESLLQTYVLNDASLYPAGYANFNQLQFQVWIYDRAGNKSNVLVTPTIDPYQ